MSLYQNMQNDPVSELSLRSPHVVTAGTVIRDTIGEMRQRNLGCTILVDRDRAPIGMFTESMLTQMLSQTPKAIDGVIEDHAAEQWPWVRLTDPITHVLDAMQLKNVRLLCVVDGDDRLAGVTGQRGLMEYLANHLPGGVAVRRVGDTAFGDRTESTALYDRLASAGGPPTARDPLEQALAEETVCSIQHEPFVTITPDTSVHEATKKLAGLHVACLLVAENERLLGVFSERDVLNNAALEFDEVKDHCTSDVMTSNPVYVHDTDSPAAALSVMAISGYRHVPVLDKSDQLVGVVSPQRVTAFLQRYFEVCDVDTTEEEPPCTE